MSAAQFKCQLCPRKRPSITRPSIRHSTRPSSCEDIVQPTGTHVSLITRKWHPVRTRPVGPPLPKTSTSPSTWKMWPARQQRYIQYCSWSPTLINTFFKREVRVPIPPGTTHLSGLRHLAVEPGPYRTPQSRGDGHILLIFRVVPKGHAQRSIWWWARISMQGTNLQCSSDPGILWPQPHLGDIRSCIYTLSSSQCSRSNYDPFRQTQRDLAAHTMDRRWRGSYTPFKQPPVQRECPPSFPPSAANDRNLVFGSPNAETHLLTCPFG